VQESPVVLAAALINRQAAVQYLLDRQPENVWLLGSGWEGTFSLEDTVCAGAIASALADKANVDMGNDEVFGAIALYRQWQDNLLELFHHASHGQRLLRLDCLEDLKYCAQTDILDVLPIQREAGVLVKNT
jgi:2-phosphosulfolactate phosphatase